MVTFFLFVILVIVSVILCIAVFFSDEIKATKDRDPAAKGYLQIILMYPGLHAIVAYRMAHGLWIMKFYFVARLISQAARFFTGVEIHPGAVIGKGLFIDHGMGVVIGETTIIGNNVTLYQGVTLGGTGKETGKRHPTIADNVVVGTGAKILGSIMIGSNTYVGANAVVIRNVPENSTVVGVPGHITKQDGKKIDVKLAHSKIMDPIRDDIDALVKRVEELEKKLNEAESKKSETKE